MATSDVAFGLLSAAAVLYGFVIAYYAFARAMQDQQEWRYQDARSRRTKRMDRQAFDDAVWSINFRRVLLDGFLLLTSLFVLLSVASGIGYLYTGNQSNLDNEAAWLTWELILVIMGFFTVGSLHLIEYLPKLRSPKYKD